MGTVLQPRDVLAVIALGLFAFGADANTDGTRDAPLRPFDAPDTAWLQLPGVLGTPISIIAPALPSGVLQIGDSATFEIDFQVDSRGTVVQAALHSATHPELGPDVLAAHREWIYAVATRFAPCKAQRFAGRQRIAIARSEGGLEAAAEPAAVTKILDPPAKNAAADSGSAQIPSNYANVMGAIQYPRAALVAGVQASFSLIVEFGAEGHVVDAYPTSPLQDQWGFTAAALDGSRALRFDPPLGRSIKVCIPIDFKLR